MKIKITIEKEGSICFQDEANLKEEIIEDLISDYFTTKKDFILKPVSKEEVKKMAQKEYTPEEVEALRKSNHDADQLRRIFGKVNEFYKSHAFNQNNFTVICDQLGVTDYEADIEKLFETSADDISEYIHAKKKHG